MPDSSLQLIFDVNSPTLNGLQDSFFTQVQLAAFPDFVRGDRTLAYTLRPVVATGDLNFPCADDFETGDTFRVAIGNPDELATGGTFKLSFNGSSTGLTVLPYGIGAIALTTALSAVSVTQGFGTLVVTNPAAGVYIVNWTSTTITVPAIVPDAENLVPNCDIIVSVIRDGDGNLAQQTIVIRQQNVCFSEPATPLPAAGVSVTTEQANSAVQNKIVRIAFDAPGTYDGLYSISAIAGGYSAACGQAGPLISTDDLGLILANHPGIDFQSQSLANNVIVTKDGADFLVEFTGTLAGSALQKTITAATVANPSVLTTSAAHNYRTGDSVTITASSGTTPSLNGTYTITVLTSTTFSIPLNVTVSSSPTATVYNNSELVVSVANVSLLAPKGLRGTLDLNTLNLAEAFWATDADTLTFTFSIERERASGEIRTPVLVPVTIHRDIIDVTSLVPVTFPSALTQQTGVNWNGTITGYTGGTPTALDSLPTTGLENIVIEFVHATDGIRQFRLKTDATATLAGQVIQPVDDATKRYLSIL